MNNNRLNCDAGAAIMVASSAVIALGKNVAVKPAADNRSGSFLSVPSQPSRLAAGGAP